MRATAVRFIIGATPAIRANLARERYDDALAETTIGLYETEKINREGLWRTLSDVELATLE